MFFCEYIVSFNIFFTNMPLARKSLTVVAKVNHLKTHSDKLRIQKTFYIFADKEVGGNVNTDKT